MINDAKALRELIAKGEFVKPTSGYCEGNIQANFLALPKDLADDFVAFAKQNPKPIPILEIISSGHHSNTMAKGANLLNEIPLYNIIENGEVTKSVEDITPYYSDDLHFFLIGCSFSFENALIQNGIALRHIAEQKNVAMYRTNIPLDSTEKFSGNMVVSMRPIQKERVADACVITDRYAKTHGSPIHIGYPEMIGIADISTPDYGDAVAIEDDEIPVFWACGVTVQHILQTMKIPFAITHKAGYMLVTDKTDKELIQ